MKNRTTIISIILLSIFFAQKASCDNTISILKKNFIDRYLFSSPLTCQLDSILSTIPEDHENGDQVIREVNQHRYYTENYYYNLLKKQADDGSWPDINYSDTKQSNWSPIIHANRIFELTKAYINPLSSFYHNPEFSQAIHNAIGYYHLMDPVSKNWWYNEIGIPKTLGPVYLMIENELTEKEKEDAINIVMSKSQFKMSGQNKVWLAGNIYIKALLAHNLKLARQACDTIVSEITTGNYEGIKADFSFHQHGPQLQFGNYGMAFITGMCDWAWNFKNTPLAFNDVQLSVIRRLMLDGYHWIFWKGYLDVNSFGRQFSKDVQQMKALAAGYSCAEILNVDNSWKKQYDEFINENFKNKIPGTAEHKHFWCSDYTVHRSRNWMASTRMSSYRVIGSESGNGDNQKGYYLADGATYVYINGDEYENIFPVWDWGRIPGTTTIQSYEPMKKLTWAGYRNQSNFTGGVTDGRYGISSTILNRDGLIAYKSNFFTDNMIICLGQVDSNKIRNLIFTTVNQCLTKGDVYYKTSSVEDLDRESITSEMISAVYHNQTGYFFNKPQMVTISNAKRSGAWNKIMGMYHYEPDTKQVFTLSVTHNKSLRQYEYTILPFCTPDEVFNFHPEKHYAILENDTICQAVEYVNGSLIMASFFEPHSIKTTTGINIGLKQPGLLMLKPAGNKFQMWVSDPTQKLSEITISINNKLTTVKLPGSDQAGQPVNAVIKMDE